MAMTQLAPENRIKELREARGLSQDRLAEMVGVQVAAVHKWENRLRFLKSTRLQALADALMVQEAELFEPRPPAIVNRIRERREAAGLSDEDFAARLGWPIWRVRILEAATRIPPGDIPMDVVNALDVGLSKLWDEPMIVSGDEKELLDAYRQLAEPERASFRHIVETMGRKV